jgi:hypothetical protein
VYIEKRVDEEKEYLVNFFLFFLSRRTQRQRLSPSPETQPTPIDENQLSSLDLQESFITTKKNDHVSDQTNSITAKLGAGNSNSLPSHQSSRSKLDQQALNLSDSVNKLKI